MTKREAERLLSQLEREGWRDGELISWWCAHNGRHRNDGWSVVATGGDGGRRRVDHVGSVAEHIPPHGGA